MLCLADMPNVDDVHLASLSEGAGKNVPVMSSTGSWLSPPALIPATVAQAILDRTEATVRETLLSYGARTAQASAETLEDFDTPAQFEAFEKRYRASQRPI